jgi:hypothetical protein
MAIKKSTPPTPKEIVEKIAKTNGNTDISKKDMRDSGTKLPPIIKKK